jgi:hypothetical protein
LSLIPRRHPAVDLDNPAPVRRQLWIAWQLLDLRFSNWRRILTFASAALPWVLIWFGIAAFFVVVVLAPLTRELHIHKTAQLPIRLETEAK